MFHRIRAGAVLQIPVFFVRHLSVVIRTGVPVIRARGAVWDHFGQYVTPHQLVVPEVGQSLRRKQGVTVVITRWPACVGLLLMEARRLSNRSWKLVCVRRIATRSVECAIRSAMMHHGEPVRDSPVRRPGLASSPLILSAETRKRVVPESPQSPTFRHRLRDLRSRTVFHFIHIHAPELCHSRALRKMISKIAHSGNIFRMVLTLPETETPPVLAKLWPLHIWSETQ